MGDAISAILDRRPIAYHPELARRLKSVAAAIFLQELYHWRKYSKDGWVFRTQEEIEEETALTRRPQESARSRLRELGLVREERRGVPAKLHYYVEHDKVQLLLQSGGNVQTRSAPSDKLSTRIGTRISEEDTNVSPSADSPNGSPPKEEKPKGKALGQWAVEQLFDKVKAAKEAGHDLTPPPEVGRIGKRYIELAREYDDDSLLLAFDFMVAKASGQVDDSPKAWCGLDTAMDRVRLGWIPKGTAPTMPDGTKGSKYSLRDHLKSKEGK